MVFFALFLLVLPTGNAISERGFSAQNATHSKQRSELSHEQTLATMMIGFNGPELPEFVNDMQRDSKSLGRDVSYLLVTIMRDNYSTIQ